MRFLSLLFSIFILSSQLSAQILEPVKWTMNAEHVKNDEFLLIYKAKIDEGWTVYSQYLEGEDGPIPTTIYYDDESTFEKKGKAKELGKKKTAKDKLFNNMKVTKFLADRPFIIRQKVKVKDYSKPISGELEFMTCDKSHCLPPTGVPFKFDVKAIKAGSAGGAVAVQGGDEAVATGGSIALDAGHSDEMLAPVKWDIKVVKTSGNEFDIVYTADIQEGWTVYSQYTSDNGPVPTFIDYEDKDGLELLGKSTETGHKKEGPDKLFDNVNVIKYLADEPFVIRQKVKVNNLNKTYPGYLEYMTCDKSHCLPPTAVEFNLDFSNLNSGTAATNAGSTNATGGVAPTDGKILDQRISSIVGSLKNPVTTCGDATVKESSSMWSIFIGGFLGGLVAILLPCIFPMIPITVSFFTKDNKRPGWMNGLIYGLSIIIIFVAIGLAVTALLGPEALNKMSTSWIANVLFFIIFVAFALSFFGYYEIALPSSWSTKSDRMADKGGLVGIFFMAFTLALVSFSCTGPIIGTALVQVASSGNYLGPFMVMFGFSLALALPFGLFAAFPSWLNSLPRSGSWMTTVKVVLGFLELALALKFLSVADMTSHWGILRYELFLGLWILIFFCLALYLLGIIRFPHDAPLKIKDIKPARWLMIAATFGLVVYLALGFRVDPLTKSYKTPGLTSGLAPSAHYNFFNPAPPVDPAIQAKYPSYTKCANNINCFKDYYEGLAYAKSVNKPLFVDFTGYGCVNCRKTEEHIWVADKIRNGLNNDFVLVSLYVDDRKPLKELTYAGEYSNYSKLRNVGNKWADFQITNFGQNSQPLYVMMTNDEKVISAPRGYEEGIDNYYDFMQCGLKAAK